MNSILILDDEIHNLIWMKEDLESAGYSVKTFDNSKSAYRALELSYFDLLILDIVLDKEPNVDGLEFLEKVRVLQKHKDLGRSGVICITAFPCTDYAIRAVNLGVYRFVRKDDNNFVTDIIGTAVEYFKELKENDQVVKAMEELLKVSPYPNKKITGVCTSLM